MTCLRAFILVAAASLAGCAVSPGGPPGAPPLPPGAPPAAAAPTLASEQRRLAEAVRGTPVVVQTTTEGRLRVVVPLEFSFAPGRAAVKPPLAAVLDRIATGLKHPQAAFEVRVAAPPDARGAGGSLLAQDRAAAARDYLVARGVPLMRFVNLGRSGTDGVEVLLGERAAR